VIQHSFFRFVFVTSWLYRLYNLPNQNFLLCSLVFPKVWIFFILKEFLYAITESHFLSVILLLTLSASHSYYWKTLWKISQKINRQTNPHIELQIWKTILKSLHWISFLHCDIKSIIIIYRYHSVADCFRRWRIMSIPQSSFSIGLAKSTANLWRRPMPSQNGMPLPLDNMFSEHTEPMEK